MSEMEVPQAEATAEKYQEPSGGNYIAHHWRGDFSLGKAYWLNVVALNIAVILVSTVINMMLGHVSNVWGYGIAVIALNLSIPCLTVWQFVGTWRSAGKHVERGGQKVWAVLAFVVLTLGGLKAIGTYTTANFPVMKTAFLAMINQSKGAPYVINVLGKGDEIELAGAMPMGTASAFIQALDAHPGVKIVHLNSSGGIVKEGSLIGAEIKRRGLKTFTSIDCMSACTLAFLAGTERLLGENGRIGFHSASIVAGVDSADVNREFKTALGSVGASSSFVSRVTSTSSKDMWFPDNAELLREGVITAVVDSSKYSPAGVTAFKDDAKLEKMLQGHQFYRTMAEFDPANYEKVKNTLSKAANSGMNFNQMQQAIAVMMREQLIPEYMKKAPSRELVRYWKTQMAEATVIQKINSEQCVEFLGLAKSSSGVNFQHILPKELMLEDVAALGEMIKAGAKNPQPSLKYEDVQVELEAAMVRLLKTAPKSFAVVEKPDDHSKEPQALCAGYLDFYNEIMAAPEQSAGDILRYMIQSA